MIMGDKKPAACPPKFKIPVMDPTTSEGRTFRGIAQTAVMALRKKTVESTRNHRITDNQYKKNHEFAVLFAFQMLHACAPLCVRKRSHLCDLTLSRV